jgi:hypothetical protein
MRKNGNSFRLINASIWGFMICLMLLTGNTDALWAENDFISAGPEGGLVQALAIDPADPQTVYAGTLNGVFKSTDGGNHWSMANTGIEGIGIHFLAIDPKMTRTVYAGTVDSLFKSADAFKRYSTIPISNDFWKVEKTWPVFVDVGGIAIAPTSPPTVYAATSCCGVLKSTVGTGD